MATRAIFLTLLALCLVGCENPSSHLSTIQTAPKALPIGSIQGEGDISPMLDQSIEVQGIVTGNFVTGLGGFFMQDATGEDDQNPKTSNGIFVTWARDKEPKVRRGDRVRVVGTVVEVNRGGSNQTTIDAVEIGVLGRGVVTALALSEAPANAEEWEHYEGMWLRISAPLTVSGNDGLLRFGELVTSFGSRLYTPTELHRPGRDSELLDAENQRLRLILDDNRNSEFPQKLWYLPEPLSANAPLRVDSVVHGAEGILQNFMGWRLQLTEPLEKIEHAARPEVPELPEGIRVASFNLLNWFNGDGLGKGFPTARGATSIAEMNRQRDKLVAAITALKPDVAALMEVENDGFDRTSSLAQLITALNAEWPEAHYRLVEVSQGPGDDVMRVAMIYRDNRVTAVGDAATFSDGVFNTRHRVPLAQTFRTKDGKGSFNVVANHFKSKGCSEVDEANKDQRDGQSCWNASRTEAARALDAWVTSQPTSEFAQGTILLGDFNSYAKEDPIQALQDAGWLDAFKLAKVERPYSYNYRGYSGRLDHALISSSLQNYLRSAVEWHINADESEAFDYQIDKRQKEWYSADPYRSSDHDPLLLVLDFSDK